MQEWYMKFDSSRLLTDQEKFFLSMFTEEGFNDLCLMSDWVYYETYSGRKLTLKEFVEHFIQGDDLTC